MYRNNTYERIFAKIHELRKRQRTTPDLLSKIELGIRIENLKELVILSKKQNSK